MLPGSELNKNHENDYIIRCYFFKNVFTPEESQHLIQMAGYTSLSVIQSSENSLALNQEIRNSQTKAIPFIPENNWIVLRLFQLIYSINRDYFKFQVNELQEINVLKYETGGFYKWHVDIGKGM